MKISPARRPSSDSGQSARLIAAEHVVGREAVAAQGAAQHQRVEVGAVVGQEHERVLAVQLARAPAAPARRRPRRRTWSATGPGGPRRGWPAGRSWRRARPDRPRRRGVRRRQTARSSRPARPPPRRTAASRSSSTPLGARPVAHPAPRQPSGLAHRWRPSRWSRPQSSSQARMASPCSSRSGGGAWSARPPEKALSSKRSGEPLSRKEPYAGWSTSRTSPWDRVCSHS